MALKQFFARTRAIQEAMTKSPDLAAFSISVIALGSFVVASGFNRAEPTHAKETVALPPPEFLKKPGGAPPWEAPKRTHPRVRGARPAHNSTGEDNDDSDEDAGEREDEPSRSFAGYECTDDCSGHRAGYAWAEKHGIDDPDDCSGNSDSFIEGCIAYVDDNGDGDDSNDSSE